MALKRSMKNYAYEHNIVHYHFSFDYHKIKGRFYALQVFQDIDICVFVIVWYVLIIFLSLLYLMSALCKLHVYLQTICYMDYINAFYLNEHLLDFMFLMFLERNPELLLPEEEILYTSL